MVSILAIVLAVCLGQVLGWTYFEPLGWSPTPMWSCYLISGCTMMSLAYIDFYPRLRLRPGRIVNRNRLDGKMKLFLETFVSFALLDIVPHGVWCRLIQPLIHLAVRSLCFYMDMGEREYHQVEGLLNGFATTAVAFMLFYFLINALDRYWTRINNSGSNSPPRARGRSPHPHVPRGAPGL